MVNKKVYYKDVRHFLLNLVSCLLLYCIVLLLSCSSLYLMQNKLNIILHV